MRRFASLLAGCLLALPLQAQTVPDYLTAAVAKPERSAKDRERDAQDRPAELLAFAGVKPGMKVADFFGGGGYWSELISYAVGPTGSVTLVNCTAVNTRAGFEIGAKDDSPKKTIIDGCFAKGCERAFLLGSHVIVRRSRGDAKYGPLLYLRGGRESDIELELAGDRSDFAVHAIATVAGVGHRVKLTSQPHEAGFPRVPLMFGFGMPDHAEMSSPIRPAAANGIKLACELPGVTVITSAEVKDCQLEAAGKVISDQDLRKSPGNWGPAAPLGR